MSSTPMSGWCANYNRSMDDELSSWSYDQPFQGLEYFVGIVELSLHHAGHRWLLIRSSQWSKAYASLMLA